MVLSIKGTSFQMNYYIENMSEDRYAAGLWHQLHCFYGIGFRHNNFNRLSELAIHRHIVLSISCGESRQRDKKTAAFFAMKSTWMHAAEV